MRIQFPNSKGVPYGIRSLRCAIDNQRLTVIIQTAPVALSSANLLEKRRTGPILMTQPRGNEEPHARLINVTGTLRKFYVIGANKMWLITPTGFFSIVCKPGDMEAGTLTIRARVKSDLEDLRHQGLPSLGAITENEGTDYPYRAKAKRNDVAKALAQMVQHLEYDNFKNEVAKKQGNHRAKVYHEVWDVLYDLEKKTANSSASAQKNNKTTSASGQKPTAYGGVILDGKKRVLLRRPRGDFDGYVWTFPKGRPEPGETPELAALREVKEETGYSAKVIKELSGSFAGGTSVAKYFLMEPIGRPSSFDSEETSEIKWATLDEATTLVGMTTNKIGKERDLSVLGAVRLALKL